MFITAGVQILGILLLPLDLRRARTRHQSRPRPALPLAAVKATPENAYRSTTSVVPPLRAACIAALHPIPRTESVHAIECHS